MVEENESPEFICAKITGLGIRETFRAGRRDKYSNISLNFRTFTDTRKPPVDLTDVPPTTVLLYLDVLNEDLFNRHRDVSNTVKRHKSGIKFPSRQFLEWNYGCFAYHLF